jgi:hypothetical protein
MLGFLAVAVAGWIGLFIVLATAPQAGRSAAPNPPRAPRLPRSTIPSSPPRAPSSPSSSWSTATDQPSPAVISLLAGRLDKDGYAATLLDLAARGWLRLNAPASGPVMCAIIPGGLRAPGCNGLTAYERRAFAHAVLRAGDHTEFLPRRWPTAFRAIPTPRRPACRRRVTA